MKKFFLSFGGGGKSHTDNVEFICKQASEMDLFESVYMFTDSSLATDLDHHEFFKKFNDFMIANKRGFGYWIWKSYLISYVLNKTQLNDIIIYADAGCRLSHKRFMLPVLESLSGNCEISLEFAARDHVGYTKSSVLNELGGDFLNNKMIAATSIAIRNTEKTRMFIDKWQKLCQRTELLVDPVREAEPAGFVDHKHDQSIFSLCLYNDYPEFLHKNNFGLLRKAIFPLRMGKNGFSDSMYKGFLENVNNLAPMDFDSFDEIRLSSLLEQDKSLILYDLVTPYYKPPYSFHTPKQINPNIILSFKKAVKLDFLVIENRKGLEDRLSKLLIEVSMDDDLYVPIYLVSHVFGGLYNDRPLILSISDISFQYIRFTSVDDDPIFFHLKSIYFYSNA
jgi:hypothetical protein